MKNDDFTNVLIRMPSWLHKEIKGRAKNGYRSVTGQVLLLLESAIGAEKNLAPNGSSEALEERMND